MIYYWTDSSGLKCCTIFIESIAHYSHHSLVSGNSSLIMNRLNALRLRHNSPNNCNQKPSRPTAKPSSKAFVKVLVNCCIVVDLYFFLSLTSTRHSHPLLVPLPFIYPSLFVVFNYSNRSQKRARVSTNFYFIFRAPPYLSSHSSTISFSCFFLHRYVPNDRDFSPFSHGVLSIIYRCIIIVFVICALPFLSSFLLFYSRPYLAYLRF